MRRHLTQKPMRRCIACRESKPQDELIRFTLSGMEIRADRDRRAEGRGFYLCRDSKCLEMAIKRKSFNRACRCNIDAEVIRKVIEEELNNG